MRNTILIVSVLVVVGVLIGLGTQFFAGDKAFNKIESAAVNDKTVVAKVGGDKITVGDLLETFQISPEQLKGANVEELYPVLTEQMISQKLVDKAAEKEFPNSHPKVKEELAEAAKQIKRNLYLQETLQKGVSDEVLLQAYASYIGQLKPVWEIHANHILLKTEAEAKAVIQELDSGADFVALAKEKSTGPTAPNGGDLGYFAEGEMVKEFSDAAFALKKDEYTKTPVQTQFGWHVIRVDDQRERAQPTIEQVKPAILDSMKPQVYQELLADLKEKYKIVTYFDKAGTATKGEVTPDDAAAEDYVPADAKADGATSK